MRQLGGGPGNNLTRLPTGLMEEPDASAAAANEWGRHVAGLRKGSS